MSEKKPKVKPLSEYYKENPGINAFDLASKSGKTLQYVRNFLKKNDSQQQILYNTRHEHIDTPAGSPLADHYQADVMKMNWYKSQNKQFDAVLTVLNTTTRVVYAKPLKSLEADKIIKAMGEMLNEIQTDNHKMQVLRTDGGPEFTSNEFKRFLENNKIIQELGEPYLSNWLNRTNRFHRTLRTRFRELFAENKNNKWVDSFAKIIKEYNNSPSHAFRDTLKRVKKLKNGMTVEVSTPIKPIDITEKDIEKIHAYESKQAMKVRLNDNDTFEIGDFVRLAKQFTKEMKKENKFLKLSMLANWTDEIYKIEKRNGPNTWRICNQDGTPLKKEIKIWHTTNLIKVNQAAPTEPPKTNYVNVAKAKLKHQMELEIPKEDKARQIGDLNVRTTRQSKPKTRSKTAKPAAAEPAAEEEFTVDKLIDSKLIKRKPHILVSWRGYDESYNTWEPRSELIKDIPEMVKKFESKI
jgi:hypothetical protein